MNIVEWQNQCFVQDLFIVLGVGLLVIVLFWKELRWP